jgi:hypothetical protein
MNIRNRIAKLEQTMSATTDADGDGVSEEFKAKVNTIHDLTPAQKRIFYSYIDDPSQTFEAEERALLNQALETVPEDVVAIFLRAKDLF